MVLRFRSDIVCCNAESLKHDIYSDKNDDY